MKHLSVIQSEFLKEAKRHDWNDRTIDEQWNYLRDHPKSKKKLTAKPKSKQIQDKDNPLNREKAQKLAAQFINLHNEASKKYKDAFASVGAKMWHSDDAQVISDKSALSFITHVMTKRPIKNIKTIYKIERPLTILDSFSKVRDNKKLAKQLNNKIDSIYDEYSKKWKNILKNFL